MKYQCPKCGSIFYDKHAAAYCHPEVVEVPEKYVAECECYSSDCPKCNGDGYYIRPSWKNRLVEKTGKDGIRKLGEKS